MEWVETCWTAEFRRDCQGVATSSSHACHGHAFEVLAVRLDRWRPQHRPRACGSGIFFYLGQPEHSARQPTGRLSRCALSAWNFVCLNNYTLHVHICPHLRFVAGAEMKFRRRERLPNSYVTTLHAQNDRRRLRMWSDGVSFASSTRNHRKTHNVGTQLEMQNRAPLGTQDSHICALGA